LCNNEIPGGYFLKKIIRINAVIAAALVISLVGCSVHRTSEDQVNLDFTEQITVIDRNTETEIIITDQNHLHDIVMAIQDGITPWPRGLATDVNCPSDITLVFEGSEKKVYVSPATDDCGTISVDGILFKIDIERKAMLFDVLSMYVDLHTYSDMDQ